MGQQRSTRSSTSASACWAGCRTADTALAGARVAAKQTVALQDEAPRRSRRAPGMAAARLELPGLLLRAPARRARRDARHGPAAAVRRARRQRRLRHARGPGRQRCTTSSPAVRLDRRVPGRHRVARAARRPRPDPGLERVRPRPRENGSGTDHGAGGMSMLIGTKAKGTMVGEFPGLGTLDGEGNLLHTVDFRHVYKHVVSDWLKVDPTGIVPDAAKFTTPLSLVRRAPGGPPARGAARAEPARRRGRRCEAARWQAPQAAREGDARASRRAAAGAVRRGGARPPARAAPPPRRSRRADAGRRRRPAAAAAAPAAPAGSASGSRCARTTRTSTTSSSCSRARA